MGKHKLVNVETEYLLEQIRKLINFEMRRAAWYANEGKEYLTRKETAHYLKISLPTLHQYTKTGTLNAYRMQNRVLYKKSELEETLKSTKWKNRSKKYAENEDDFPYNF